MLLALVAMTLVLMPTLQAHDFWIEPSTFHPETGATVAIGLRVGQDFVSDAVRRSSDAIETFVVRQDGRDQAIDGIEGADPAGWLRADARTTAIIVYRSRPSYLEMTATAFEDYLRLEGLERIVRLRAERGLGDEPGRERFSRHAKALLTGRHASEDVTRPFGLTYEIVPDADPTLRLRPLRGRVLYEGEPLSGALVVAMLQRDPSMRLTARTDESGAFSLPLPCGGVWLVKSVHMVETPWLSSWLSGADSDSFWASLIFEAPGADAEMSC
jgi:hypothetical protein